MRFPFCIPFGCGSGIDILEKRQYNLHEVPQDVSRSVHTLEEIYLDGNQIKTIPDVGDYLQISRYFLKFLFVIREPS